MIERFAFLLIVWNFINLDISVYEYSGNWFDGENNKLKEKATNLLFILRGRI
jgi:hypothetical protein